MGRTEVVKYTESLTHLKSPEPYRVRAKLQGSAEEGTEKGSAMKLR